MMIIGLMLAAAMVLPGKSVSATEPALRIAVLSDTQGYAYKEDWGFSNAEKALAMLAGGRVDVIVSAGDIADGDSPEAIRYYVGLVDRYLGKVAHVACNGNHELRPRGNRTGEEQLADFNRAFGFAADARLIHQVIKGYDFITFSQIRNEPYTAADCALIGEALEKAVARDAKKPIFVVTHYHPARTVLASDDEWGVELRKLLDRYPQVVSLSGHTHNPLRDPRNIWQGTFTAIETSTLSYGCHPGSYENMLSCLIPFGREAVAFQTIEVYGDHLTVERFNPQERRQIDESWTIAVPYRPETARYTDARVKDRVAPQFPEGARAFFRYDFGFTYIIFERAALGDFVHDYRLAITEVDGSGQVLGETKSFCYLDDFYRPEGKRGETFVLKTPPHALLAGRTYRFDIYPRESFGLEGRPLSLTIAISPTYGFKNTDLAYPQE